MKNRDILPTGTGHKLKTGTVPAKTGDMVSLDIGIAVSYCFVLQFCAPNGKFVFSASLLLSVFLHPPDETK